MTTIEVEKFFVPSLFQTNKDARVGAAVCIRGVKGAPDDVVSCDAPLLQQLQDGITAHLSSAGVHLNHVYDAL